MLQHREGNSRVKLSFLKGQVLSVDATESQADELFFQVGAVLNTAGGQPVWIGIPPLKEIVVWNLKVRCRSDIEDAALAGWAEQPHDSLIHSPPHSQRTPYFQSVKQMFSIKVVNGHRFRS